MPRKITITIDEELDHERYADLANAVWMLMRNTPYVFSVKPDGKTPAAMLNNTWKQYGDDARWE